MTQQSAFGDLMTIITGYQRSRALMVAAELGIADLVRHGPRPVADLALATQTHEPTLYRLLRALASIGVFEEDGQRRFSLTPMGELLRTDAPFSARSLARFFGRDYQWTAWGALLHSVRTGENAARHTLGVDVWTYREQHPKENEIFNAAMETMSKATGPLEAAAYDFSRCTTIADIAGGTGVLLGHILTRTPGARGILFDQAHVVAEAPPVLAAAGVAHRVTIESGSFFERVPAGADAYVMKRILHDWPDKESIDILRCCRKAMTPQARLVLVESIVGPPNEDQFSKFLDLTMLVSAGGRERTQAEWAALLSAGGFQLESATPASPNSCAIVAAPV